MESHLILATGIWGGISDVGIWGGISDVIHHAIAILVGPWGGLSGN
jgi:hypothetical protein